MFFCRYGAELSDNELREAARAEMLERMEAQLASEGVDVKGVTNIMEEMSKRNRELFQLPPYVLYVARAFSTLEGIGLSIDENYAIVQECYPYLARRLFTDRSPRAKRALRAMLGLSEDAEQEQPLVSQQTSTSALSFVQNGAASAVAGSDTDQTGSSNSLSPGKLIEMSQGFASYTAATANVDRDGAGQQEAIRELAKLILLSPKGSTIQDILVEESARLGDAATRAALRRALLENPAAQVAKAALQTPKQILEQFQPLRRIFPGPLKEALVDRPSELPELLEALLASNSEDETVLATAAELRDALVAQFQENMEDLRPNGSGGTSPESLQQMAASLAQTVGRSDDGNTNASLDLMAQRERLNSLVTEELPGVAALGRRLGAGLLRRAAYRADQSTVLPEATRKTLVDANRRLATAVDVDDSNDQE